MERPSILLLIKPVDKGDWIFTKLPFKQTEPGVVRLTSGHKSIPRQMKTHRLSILIKKRYSLLPMGIILWAAVTFLSANSCKINGQVLKTWDTRLIQLLTTTISR